MESKPPAFYHGKYAPPVLLSTASLSVMAGALIAPSLPTIKDNFRDEANVEVLVRLLVTMPSLAIVFSSPFIGSILNYFGRVRVLLFGCILFAGAGATGIYLNDLVVILVFRGVLGIAISAIQPSVTTLIGDYWPPQHRSKILGYMSGTMSVGGFFFLNFAGLLALIHWRGPFYVYLLSIPMAILVLLILKEPPFSRVGKRKEEKRLKLHQTGNCTTPHDNTTPNPENTHSSADVNLETRDEQEGSPSVTTDEANGTTPEGSPVLAAEVKVQVPKETNCSEPAGQDKEQALGLADAEEGSSNEPSSLGNGSTQNEAVPAESKEKDTPEKDLAGEAQSSEKASSGVDYAHSSHARGLPGFMFVGLVVTAFVMQFIFYLCIIEVPFFLDEDLGTTNEYISGFVLSMSSFFSGMCGMRFGWFRRAVPTLILLAFPFFGFAGCFLALYLAHHWAWALCALAIFGLGLGAGRPLIMGVASERSSPLRRAMVMSSITCSMFAGRFSSGLANVSLRNAAGNRRDFFGYVGILSVILAFGFLALHPLRSWWLRKAEKNIPDPQLTELSEVKAPSPSL
eukprot:GCRY01004594.1.p1 GENE.GCRY01004594.1~~GCRY01004594.1.p1  ORF type:complete len:569 (-),score=75.74 GCRY01004594.1:635-2341(-)